MYFVFENWIEEWAYCLVFDRILIASLVAYTVQAQVNSEIYRPNSNRSLGMTEHLKGTVLPYADQKQFSFTFSTALLIAEWSKKVYTRISDIHCMATATFRQFAV